MLTQQNVTALEIEVYGKEKNMRSFYFMGSCNVSAPDVIIQIVAPIHVIGCLDHWSTRIRDKKGIVVFYYPSFFCFKNGSIMIYIYILHV